MEFLKTLQSIRTPLLDSFFLIITKFGEEVLLLLIICILYWCVNKKMAYRISLCFLGSGLAVQALKISFRIPRPWIKDSSLIPVKQAVTTATGYSFPSGHTQSATAIYTTLAIHSKKFTSRILYGLLIVGVMFSRMYLGVHTPADVFTSFFISFSLALIIDWLTTQFDLLNQHFKLTSLVLLFLSGTAAVYSIFLLNKNVITISYAADCCKAAGAGIGFAVGFYMESSYIKFSTKAKNIGQQILKLIVGILIALILKSCLKEILGTSILAGFIRYIILVLWITVFYPCIINYYNHKMQNTQ